jgi:hypothetical protein
VEWHFFYNIAGLMRDVIIVVAILIAIVYIKQKLNKRFNS